jgi:hypothetical protein
MTFGKIAVARCHYEGSMKPSVNPESFYEDCVKLRKSPCLFLERIRTIAYVNVSSGTAALSGSLRKRCGL